MHAKKEHVSNTGRPLQQAAFDLLRKTNKRWVGKGCAVQAVPHMPKSNSKNEESPKKLRFCVITSKKTCQKAVDRNRLRRRIRAAALEILPISANPDMDYMLVGRVQGLNLPFTDLKKEIVWCLKKLDLKQENPTF